MTLIKPRLKLNRLVIWGTDGKVVFDQNFHNGLNIIRGTNSSGKSTIANFIFYALGGDFTHWTSAAEQCDNVIAEIEINEKLLTLKRFINRSQGQPLYIFWGNYDEAIKNVSEGWNVYGYKQTSSRQSFSNILFSILEYPELKGDYESNITMHQVLRLLYIDQKSPTLSLFKSESFDSYITRKTIGDLLLGLYDNELYEQRLAVRDLKKEYTEKDLIVKGIINLYSQLDSETDIEQIETEINKTHENLKNINNQLSEVEKKSKIILNKKSKLIYEYLYKKISDQKKRYYQILERVKEYEFEIEDSAHFIEVLERRSKALEDSNLIKENLGLLPITYCPSCLSTLEKISESEICHLCKQPIKKNEKESPILRMQIELENQLNESKKLLKEKKETYSKFNLDLLEEEEKAKELQKSFDLQLEKVKTTRESKLDELQNIKGKLESKIDFLIKELKASKQIEILREELNQIEKDLKNSQNIIMSKELKQKQRFMESLSVIQNFTLQILKEDLERQAEFKNGQNVYINFEKDTFALDGKNNFSESSNTLLKNALRFGIFFTSLELDYFRLPRFIICDNTEDKGMEEKRSQNFQKVIYKISQDYKIEHQIILTTSMIAPELNINNVCVGAEYSENNKTLKL